MKYTKTVNGKIMTALIDNEVQAAAFIKGGWEPVTAPAAPGDGGKPSERDALKVKASALGLEYPSNISTAKLAALVADAEASTDSSTDEDEGGDDDAESEGGATDDGGNG